jgi:hypothetical protein
VSRKGAIEAQEDLMGLIPGFMDARKAFTTEDFDLDMMDIALVMEQSGDLVEVIHESRQIFNVKGD